MKEKIAIIGSGSWATAIAKILHQKHIHFSWYFRNPKNIKKFLKLKHNPNYLTGTSFNVNQINFSSNLEKTLYRSEVLILAIPSIYLEETLTKCNVTIADKKIISAIKGLIPSKNSLLVSDYLAQRYNVKPQNFCMISGPSHSEEIALERLSFLTIVGSNTSSTEKVANLLLCDYIKTSTCNDVCGVEYIGILKNIMAIAVGIAHGLNFGNNFIAVLIANAIQEIEKFLSKVDPTPRDLKASPYLGDLLTTTYSKFSRNRTFGTMIGKGYSAKTAILEMNMVVEGYYALKHLKSTIDEMNLNLPIYNTVYDIICKNENINITIQKLIEKLK